LKWQRATIIWISLTQGLIRALDATRTNLGLSQFLKSWVHKSTTTSQANLANSVIFCSKDGRCARVTDTDKETDTDKQTQT